VHVPVVDVDGAVNQMAWSRLAEKNCCSGGTRRSQSGMSDTTASVGKSSEM
jgi:hypothetical protein